MARDGCLARIAAGVAVGGALGGAVGAVYGTYEVIRFKLKEMAERLPVGAARYSSNSPPFGSSSPTAADVSVRAMEQLSSPISCHEPDLNGSDNLIFSNGLSPSNSHISGQPEVGHTEATGRNKNRPTKADPPTHEDEWVEHAEPGVFITLVTLPGGLKDIKRVRFSRKRFSEKQAEQWWATNRARICQQYNVSIVEKAPPGAAMGREGLAH